MKGYLFILTVLLCTNVSTGTTVTEELITFQGNSKTGFNPPDGSLTVGTDRIMSAVNGQIRLFDKSTLVVLDEKRPKIFFGSGESEVSPKFVFDPRLLYDPVAQRFIAIFTDGTSYKHSYIWIAVSKGSSPNALTTNDFYLFHFDADEQFKFWADYPMAGLDAGYLYITLNMFGDSADKHFRAPMFVIDTEKLYQGEFVKRPVYFKATGAVFSNQPAMNWDKTFGDNWSGNLQGSGDIRLFHLTVDKTNFTVDYEITNVACETKNAGSKSNALQKGSDKTIGWVDSRMQNSFVINNKMYLSRTAGHVEEAVIWYIVDLDTLTCESGFIEQQNKWFFEPTIAANRVGTTLVSYIQSHASIYPSIYYSVRKQNENSFSEPQLGVSGMNSYLATRYGDYGGIALDPVDEKRFWTGHMIPNKDNKWEFHVMSVCPDCVDTPPVCDPSCVNGFCIADDVCECEPGYIGNLCDSEFECDHGVMDSGQCVCAPGWVGMECSDCDTEYFFVQGSELEESNWGQSNEGNTLSDICLPCELCDHGTCTHAGCVCSAGWTGPLCNHCDGCQDCDPECVHGKCLDSVCICNPGYIGDTCDQLECFPTCVNGECVSGTCQCQAGWSGERCDQKECPYECIHGTCNKNLGECVCDSGWDGVMCDQCTDCIPEGRCLKDSDCPGSYCKNWQTQEGGYWYCKV